jgi:hypothetical protein
MSSGDQYPFEALYHNNPNIIIQISKHVAAIKELQRDSLIE